MSRASFVAYAIAVAACGFGALAGCGGDDGPATCLPDCAASRDYDVESYRLVAALDWDERTLTVDETVTVVMKSGDRVIELDADVEEVQSVRYLGEDVGYRHDREAGTLRIDFSRQPQPSSNNHPLDIRYRTLASSALVFTAPRDDDPVSGRVVYTNSEPASARRWLISNDHPSDRATFSIELAVEDGVDVVANGERVWDGDGRVGYRIDQAIPTYLMAFAAGDLVHTETTGGRVPIAVWHRRGAPVDTTAHLDLLARQMAQFEALVGPYPFARYAVVLLPGFPGGMENATITFNSETSGLGAISENLNAHELAHHWFGDWVTMRDYRDAWIKEGLATLLAAEASRPQRDGEARGRLMGAQFNFDPDDAVVDDELTGIARYTSGPYERAAWMMTQARAKIGDAAFWATLREVLADHALGTIDGADFIAAFAPELDAATAARWLAALPVKGAPAIGIAVAGNAVTLTLTDADALLFDSIPVAVVDAAGSATSHQLAPGAPLSLTVPAGGYLAADERDVHPYWQLSFAVDADAHAALVPLTLPTTEPARVAFGARSAAAQERALSNGALALEAALLGPTYLALDSTAARRSLVFDACRTLAQLPAGDPAIATWVSALAPLLETPAITAYTTSFAPCARALPATGIAGELAGLAGQGAAIAPARLARLEYVLGFDPGAAATFAAVSQVALSAPSIRHRDLALDRLAAQTRAPYAGVGDDQLAAYRGFIRERLPEATSGTRLLILWRAVTGLADVEALSAVGTALGDIPLDRGSQRRIVCEARALAGDGAGWEAFRDAAQPWSALSPEARAALTDPAVCQ